ncbi:GNAT family N-acetyltransferase [Virgibacillus salarius]|uniref:GNAT family N-acetyltransferase n=1 Tax=Virgibacillus salarius TaxID=447199 RepID=UPI00249336A3|nr:GNAT family N-acetyltransferase [Virgibacillus salarius]WBX80229.1 GNAT family N-acetyltransferase [Virgibacillus salarius]
MKIRKAIMADAAKIAYVHVESWKSTYKGIIPDAYIQKQTYERRTNLWNDNLRNQTVFIAEDHTGNIVGFAVGGQERTNDYPSYQGELYAIYLLKNYQGIGIGRRLFRSVTQQLRRDGFRSMLVLVLADNNARYFYETMGAKRIDAKEIMIAEKKLTEYVYGWHQL